MGRLNVNRSGEQNVQYTRLKDTPAQYTGSSESVASHHVMPGFEGYISFSCRQCGHLQIFQGTELEMILGKSLKMAFRSSRKTQQSDNVQPTSFDHQRNAENVLSIKNNIPMTVRTSETLSNPAIGIPVMSGVALSSDESNSPTQLNQFKRIVEKPFLMKRIGKGFVLSASDEEGYPLVSDGSSSIPGSQTNISLLNAEPGSSDAATMRIGDIRPESSSSSSKQLNSAQQQRHHNLQYDTTDDESTGTNNTHQKRENNLRMAPWYQEGIPREIALEILSQEPIGSFMVRRSTTKIGCFALSVRVPRSFQPRGIAHYLIMRTTKGYRIKGFTKDFPTLASLIAHHSVMPELLPCPLSLSRYHPVCVISDCRRDFADIEPEPDG